jgi:predicted aspartyl protease
MIRGALSTSCGTDKLEPPGAVVQEISVADLTGHIHPRVWPGLIDTGADRSVIPLSICDDLRLTPRDMRSPSGFDPTLPRHQVPRYYVQVQVGGVESVPLLVYGVQRSTILLGRDFLRKLALVFDSPSRRFAVGEHRRFNRFLLNFLPLR